MTTAVIQGLENVRECLRDRRPSHPKNWIGGNMGVWELCEQAAKLLRGHVKPQQFPGRIKPPPALVRVVFGLAALDERAKLLLELRLDGIKLAVPSKPARSQALRRQQDP